MKQINTQYTLIMDDDWIMTNQTKLEDAFHLLETNNSIGIVCGFLCYKEPLDDCRAYQGINFKSYLIK